jgi:hypothetical protein
VRAPTYREAGTEKIVGRGMKEKSGKDTEEHINWKREEI